MTASELVGPGHRIIQVHPTLRCNLTCHHCYSTSGPDNRAEFAPEVLCRALDDAASMGYEVVSFSGGEPFMYRPLDDVLAHARSLGLRTTVTTNGTMLEPRRLESLRPHLDALAVSVDGPPELHNRIRDKEWAFDRLLHGMANVRDAEIPFGLIFTVTRKSWQHLVWIGRFAVEQEARLLQLHPLELIGRAVTDMSQDMPHEDVFARVYLMAAALEVQHRHRLTVQLDLFLTDEVRRRPDAFYAVDLDESLIPHAAPADLMGLLVVETDGNVVPISYGFSPTYRICNLNEAGLAQSWAAYLKSGYRSFRHLCRSVWTEVVESDRQLVNWHELIVDRSLCLAAV